MLIGAFESFCKQDGSRSDGSRDRWLVTVCSVCLRRSYTTGTCAYARGGLSSVFVNRADPDQAAHVRAAWSCSALFA